MFYGGTPKNALQSEILSGRGIFINHMRVAF